MNPADRGLERAANVAARERDPAQQPGDEVAPGDGGLGLVVRRPGGADLDLRHLGRLLADQQLVDVLDVVDDRVVHLVAADADRLPDHHPAEGDHRDLGRAAADVDHHAGHRVRDGQVRADRGGHRLLDQVDRARSRGARRLVHGAALDVGDPAGHAEHDSRVGEARPARLRDEVAQHLLGDLEVGDHAVPQRPDRADRSRRPADHPLGLGADRVHAPRLLRDRDHGRLEEDDSAPANEHERVRRAEIDRHVAAAAD